MSSTQFNKGPSYGLSAEVKNRVSGRGVPPASNAQTDAGAGLAWLCFTLTSGGSGDAVGNCGVWEAWDPFYPHPRVSPPASPWTSRSLASCTLSSLKDELKPGREKVSASERAGGLRVPPPPEAPSSLPVETSRFIKPLKLGTGKGAGPVAFLAGCGPLPGLTHTPGKGLIEMNLKRRRIVEDSDVTSFRGTSGEAHTTVP